MLYQFSTNIFFTPSKLKICLKTKAGGGGVGEGNERMHFVLKLRKRHVPGLQLVQASILHQAWLIPTRLHSNKLAKGYCGEKNARDKELVLSFLTEGC